MHFSGLFFNSLCRYDILQGVQINMGIKWRLLYRLCSMRYYLSCLLKLNKTVQMFDISVNFKNTKKFDLFWPFCHIQVVSQCPCILGHPVVARSWPGHNFTSLFIHSSLNFFCQWEKCKFRFAFLRKELLEAWTEYCTKGKHLYKPS